MMGNTNIFLVIINIVFLAIFGIFIVLYENSSRTTNTSPPKLTEIRGITEILQASSDRPQFSVWSRKDHTSPAVQRFVWGRDAEITYDVPDDKDFWMLLTGDHDKLSVHLHRPGEIGGTDTGGKSHVQISPIK